MQRNVAAKILTGLALCGLGAWVNAHAAEGLTAQDLMKKTASASRPKQEESVYKMRLIDQGGQEIARTMRVWLRSENDEKIKLLIKFDEPANIRGTGFLTVASGSGDPEQWLYLPALKKSRRIVGGGSNESFLGSDFSVADISVSSYEGIDSKISGEEACGDAKCSVVELTPKAGQEANHVHSKKIFKIRKDNFITASAEFYNKNGQLEKVMSSQGIHKDASGQWLSDKIEMKNVLTQHKTVIEYVKRDVSKAPADHIFTRANLEK